MILENGIGFLLLLSVSTLTISCSTNTSQALKAPQLSVANIVMDGDTMLVPKGDTLLLDAIGQVYHFSKVGKLHRLKSANRFSNRDTLIYSYQNPRLGKLSSVDLTNPLRPLLFYQDAQVAIWLNSNLTELRRVNLIDLGYLYVEAIAYAPNDGIWAFSSDRQSLIFLDQNGEILQESADLSRTFGQPIIAEQLLANPQQLVLKTAQNRVLLFSSLGAYRTELIGGAQKIQLLKSSILLRRKNQWIKYIGPEYPLVDIMNPNESIEMVSISSEYSMFRNEQRYWVEKYRPAAN